MHPECRSGGWHCNGTYHGRASGSVNGISKVTATQLKDKKRQMNLAIEAKDPEFGFSFKVNEDAGTNIYCPLILQGAVKEPGFGGSDFGDGGDI